MSRSESSADQEIERLNASAFDASGVDLTQIDWMLALTPLERMLLAIRLGTLQRGQSK